MEKNVESDPNPPLASGPEFPPATTPADVKNDVALEKSVVPPPEVKADESKALAVVEKTPDSAAKKKLQEDLLREMLLSQIWKKKSSCLLLGHGKKVKNRK